MNFRKIFGWLTIVAVALLWIPIPFINPLYIKIFQTIAAGILGVLVVAGVK